LAAAVLLLLLLLLRRRLPRRRLPVLLGPAAVYVRSGCLPILRLAAAAHRGRGRLAGRSAWVLHLLPSGVG
jgi:hypothetical protein